MSSLLTGKPQLSRFINRRLILDKIRCGGVVSRAELAKLTAIRPPTVSAVVKELIEEGLVEEIGQGETSGGRAPRLISLFRGQPRALGFEMSETCILAGLCDLAGDLTSCRKVSFVPASPEQSLDMLQEVGNDLIEEAGIGWDDLHGIGVAIPGHLNVSEGFIRWSRPFDWRNVPFKQLCEKRWKIDTDVVNDSVAGGMAAQWFETEESVANLIFLYLRFQDALHKGVGVGSGIIINGQPFHGEFGAAGEITTPVSHPLLVAKEEEGKVYRDMTSFANSLEAGEASAQAALRRVGDELVPLIQHAVNLIEPGILMIGSDTPTLLAPLIQQLRGALEGKKLAYEAGQTLLLASSLGEYGVVRGASVPTLQRLFRIPQWS